MSEDKAETKQSEHLEALLTKVVAEGFGTGEEHEALINAVRVMKKIEREQASKGEFNYKAFVG